MDRLRWPWRRRLRARRHRRPARADFDNRAWQEQLYGAALHVQHRARTASDWFDVALAELGTMVAAGESVVDGWRRGRHQARWADVGAMQVSGTPTR
jgi:hypothetical protein